MVLGEEVAVHARAILLADMRARRGFYERLGMSLDATVDFETVEAHSKWPLFSYDGTKTLVLSDCQADGGSIA
jgi:hypothetical protein